MHKNYNSNILSTDANPLVSVIIACYNAASFLETAINSALKQSYHNIEIVCVDDCSTDNSMNIAESFAATDKRVRVFRTIKNCGAGAARNLAIEHARGQWLAILDADDVFLPNKLTEQMQIIKNKRDDLVLVGSGCYQIEEHGNRVKQYSYPTLSALLKYNLKKAKKFPPHSSLLYKTSVVRTAGGFNEKMLRSQDFDLWLRLMNIGAFACSPLPLIKYRVHGQNISHQRSKAGFSQMEYGIAASVCQILRQAGENDPSLSTDEHLWLSFMNCVSATIDRSGYKEYFDWKKLFKKEFHMQTSTSGRLSSVVGTICTSPARCARLLQEQIGGSALPNVCYKAWLSFTKTTCEASRP